MPIANIEQRRLYHRKWVANRRLAFFKDKTCVVCGAGVELQLDHINRDEKISHSIWSWSFKRRNAEIEKCQILCKKCHALKTIAENRKRTGELVGTARLTNKEADKIRELYYSRRIRFKDITKKYKISKYSVYRILKFESYI